MLINTWWTALKGTPEEQVAWLFFPRVQDGRYKREASRRARSTDLFVAVRARTMSGLNANQFIDESGQSSPDWPVPATPASLTLSNPQGQLPRWPSAVSAPFQKILRGVWKCSHCSYMYVQVEVPYTNSRCDVTSTVLFCVISSLRMGVSESSADRWRRVLCFNARVTLTSFWLHTSSRESHHTVYHCTAS